LDAAPQENKCAKLFELQIAELLIRAGTGHGTALKLAEVLCVDPKALAEMLHRISNEFLTSQATPVHYWADNCCVFCLYDEQLDTAQLEPTSPWSSTLDPKGVTCRECCVKLRRIGKLE
jgi:hypothetical protein